MSPEGLALTVYLAGDGDLAPAAQAAVRSLRRAAAVRRARVAFLADGPERCVFEGWVDGERRVQWRGSRVNVGDPTVLSRVLRAQAAVLGPSQLVLVFWGHGTGWVGQAPTQQRAGGEGAFPMGLVARDTQAGDWLETDEILGALALRPTGADVSVLAFDACHMAGVELFSVLAPYAEVMIGSADAVPARGWSYSGLVRSLGAAPGPVEFARAVVAAYARRQAGSAPHSMVAVTAAGAKATMGALDALGAAVRSDRLITTFGAALRGWSAVPYGGQWYFGVDVVDVVALARSVAPTGSRTARAASQLLAEARSARVAGWASPERERLGLSVYLGERGRVSVAPQYIRLVGEGSAWGSLLASAWGQPVR